MNRRILSESLSTSFGIHLKLAWLILEGHSALLKERKKIDRRQKRFWVAANFFHVKVRPYFLTFSRFPSGTRVSQPGFLYYFSRFRDSLRATGKLGVVCCTRWQWREEKVSVDLLVLVTVSLRLRHCEIGQPQPKQYWMELFAADFKDPPKNKKT